MMLRASHWVVLAASLGATFLGLWAVRRSGALDDPGWVVIDEVSGQWVSLLGVPSMPGHWPDLAWVCAAFVLFRLFDILKPVPVGWADRHHSAWGVIGDDLIAGAMTAAVLWSWTMLR